MGNERDSFNAGAAKLYTELASWWPLLSPPHEYAEEAGFYRETLLAACAERPRTVLELGSGGGNNASHLKTDFEMTLVDVSPAMLQVSRALNPECEHVEGDMRSVRLGRVFDCVFIHDAVCYMTSISDLRRTFETAFVHCRPGGVVLVAPDYIRENFEPSTDHGGYDDGPRGLRYLDWTWDPDPTDTTFIADYAYLLRDADGSTRVVHDRHVGGLFPRAEWLASLSAAGFEAISVHFEHTGVETNCGREGFLGRRPPA